jgi:flagellar motility protein MotE (MotC chaperone)
MIIKTESLIRFFLGFFIVFLLSGCLPSQEVLQNMLEQRKITQKIYIKNDVDAYDTYKKDKKVLQVLKRGEEYNIIDVKENFVLLEKNESNNLKNDVWIDFDEIETRRTYFLTLMVNPSDSIIMINSEKYEPNKRVPEGNYKIDLKADKYLEKNFDIKLDKDTKIQVILDFDIEAEKERIAIKKIEEEKKEKLRKEKIKQAKIKKERKEKLYIDKKQNLIWQDDNMVLTNKKTWITEENYNNKKYFDTRGDTAATYCKKLTLGDFKDWRLPTKDELKNLSFQKNDLKNVASNWYWSGTTSSINNELAWSIYFDNSDGYADFKNVSNYVRCVRNK